MTLAAEPRTLEEFAHELTLERRRNSVQMDQINRSYAIILEQSSEITRLRQGIVGLMDWLASPAAGVKWRTDLRVMLKGLLAEPKPKDPDT